MAAGHAACLQVDLAAQLAAECEAEPEELAERMRALTREIMTQQETGRPVHEWPL